MRLADDRRARVPFALIAVLLLVSSTALATTLTTRSPPQIDRAADEAIDRVETDTRLALRGAVADAAEGAAREPVTRPADTTAGRAIREEQPFRDALRLRIYLQARDRFSTVEYRDRTAGSRPGSELTAHASLPATPNAAALRAARDRVQVEAVDNGTAMRVTLRNVTLVAERDGETVARTTESYTVTVDTPVLAMHDRAVAFEQRLNRGPVEGPGLGRQLSARLYPIAWSRGALQYGGAPIQNVVTNRHVALAANGGVLSAQRATFGHADPDGMEAYNRAEDRTAMTDVLAPTPAPAGEVADELLPPPNPPVEATQQTPSGPSDAAGLDRDSDHDPEDGLVVGVNHSADRALIATTDDEPQLGTRLEEQYHVDAHLKTRVQRVSEPSSASASPPGENWTLAATATDRTTSVEQGSAPLPDAGEGRTLQTHTRVVTERVEVERTWRRGEHTRRTTDRQVSETRVGVAVVVKHDPPGEVPEREVAPLFRQGGALDGPNLADVREQAPDRLLADRGGPDAVAERAAAGRAVDDSVVIEGDRPERLEPWVRADLAELHDEVRSLSVQVEHGAIAAGDANPPEKLAAIVERRRSALLAAPNTYDGAPDRARVAVRAAYLDAVLDDLEDRAERRAQTNQQLAAEIDDTGSAEAPEAGEAMDARSQAERPDREPIGEGPRQVRLEPSAEPAYLTRGAVERGPVAEPYEPLATRNLNLFTVPYGDAIDAAGERAGETVDLGTAGRTLLAAEYVLEAQDDVTADEHHRKLAADTEDGLNDARAEASDILVSEGGLETAAAVDAIAATDARYGGLGERAVAVSNGSYAETLATEAAVRGDLDDGEQELLAAQLRVAFHEVAAEEARIKVSPVNRTATRTRKIGGELLESKAKDAAGDLTEDVAHRALGDSFRGVPAGLPVLPVPGYWVATVNVWHVQVRGSYGRFTIHARNGTSSRLGEGTATRSGGPTYVRDGATVELDATGDGTDEAIGHNDRISFETRTVVVIAVPPGGRGVGDVDGVADERSEGWPCPGPVGSENPPCPSSDEE